MWDVPIGRGRKVGNGMDRFADAFIGNWQINGILTFRSGLPLTIRANDNSGSLSRGYRADRIGTGGKIGEVGQGGRWFDTSAYAVPRAGTLGSAGNGTERGPELRQYDVSLQKELPLWEGGRLELRGEFLNVTNTPQFNHPAVQWPQSNGEQCAIRRDRYGAESAPRPDRSSPHLLAWRPEPNSRKAPVRKFRTGAFLSIVDVLQIAGGTT